MELLSGQRYSVASYGIAAAYAGWLLRQYGDEVTHETALDPEGIGAFLGQDAMFSAQPAVRAEPGGTLITDAPVTQAARAQLGHLAENARVIWITPWGLQSPWAERLATDLLLQAAGGWMSAVGEPGREPIGPPGAQVQFVGGLFGAIAALREFVSHGEPAAPAGLIDVPLVETVAGTTIYDAIAFQYLGNVRARVGNRFAATQATLATLACKDGHVGLHAALYRQWVQLCKLVGHPELPGDQRFANGVDRGANVAALDEYLLPWFAERTRWEAYHELQRHRIPASGHPTMPEVLDSPQLAARDSWQTVTTPAGRTYRVPGSPARVQAGTSRATRSAAETGPWLDGRLRVVDLSMGWAGPMVPLNLAAFGADVIKVESHTHFDWWRGSRPPGDDPALAIHEHSHVFNAVNRGKRGITINLRAPEGASLAKRLIATADVVVENYAGGIMEKLGLDYETLSAANPGLIMLRLPGYGSGGPESGYLTFGNTIEGMSGLTSLMGYEGGPPMMMSNAAGDPIGGLNGTIAVLAALAARAKDGCGRLIECSQIEGFLPLVSEALIEFQRTGKVPERRGNRRVGSDPSGLFPCAGDDQWIALEVRNDDEWRALASVAGEPWALEDRYGEAGGRAANRSELCQQLGAWTTRQDRDALVERCVAAGVPAGPLFNESEVLGNEPFASSGFWVGQDREHVGFHFYPALPMVFAGERPVADGPAPTLGEHNAEVFAALGLSDEELDRLRAAHVIGEVPIHA
jgi:crotonobetainyl-CoA:carnitine CoA-transferase CaiB-like acyl-CoA transferase